MKLFSVVTLAFVMLMSASTVNAHRSDSEAIEEASRIQNELQRNVLSMQSELTELRNLIERQQFELAKFKRQQASNSLGANSYNPNQPRFVTTENGLEPVATRSTEPVYTPQGIPSAAQTGPQPSSQFPNPVTQNNDPMSTTSTLPNQQLPSTEERLLNPNSPAPSQPVFAPVEERQIGGQPSSQNVVSQGAASPVIVAVPIETVSAQPNSAQVLANNGGGVIAIPNSGGDLSPQPSNTAPATPPSSVETEASVAIDAVMDEATLYQQGFDLVNQAKHKQAIEVFTQQLEQFPYGENADDANYWIAELKLVNGEPDEAKKYYKAIMEQYRQSTRVPFAMLRTAYIEYENGNKMEARLLLQDILQFHPRSDAAIQAKNRLAEMDS